MNKTREVIFMGIGILTGITLCGPAAQAADYLKATISSQPIYVNGQRVQMEAYSIHGNNFVKLRDIGQAVDFGVEYDAATNSVYIDPNSSYQEEVKQVEQTPGLPLRHPFGGDCPGRDQGSENCLSIWHRLPGPLPLHQQRPLWGVLHQLRGLGHPLQRHRLWGPPLAAGRPAKLGADQGRRPRRIQERDSPSCGCGSGQDGRIHQHHRERHQQQGPVGRTVPPMVAGGSAHLHPLYAIPPMISTIQNTNTGRARS